MAENIEATGEYGSEQSDNSPRPRTGILDLDFLLLALPSALLIDALGFVFNIGILANLVLGAPLIWWMQSKAGQSIGAAEIKGQPAARQAVKAAARQALRKGLIVFALEMIPLISTLPLWTPMILSTLKER